ncbi:NAD-dependent epimerase/dehydratase family protein [Mucilaginibacter gossypiicola]|nr:NAD-dependent epimerase/dehydratase family protein [Mucilaginibacter gossypiicola]
MKIVVIGATGTIGKYVTAALQDHEVIKAGSKSADVQVDISSIESIENFYKQVGKFDALICAAGDARFGPLTSMKDADFDSLITAFVNWGMTYRDKCKSS